MSRARAFAVAAALALALAGAGCGLGAGSGSVRVTLTVTRDFGHRSVGTASARRTPGSETVMRFLRRHFAVQTRYGGGFVQAINGLGGGRSGDRPVDWFYYVNGIEAPRGAAATVLHGGDRVWWDRHDWGAANRVPAVVGAFPEPFRSGSEGKRLPVRVDCASAAQAACEVVAQRLNVVAVPAATARLGAQFGAETLRLLVGTWAAVRADPAAREMARGPGASGIYARFEAGGARLALLDDRGTRALAPAPGSWPPPDIPTSSPPGS